MMRSSDSEIYNQVVMSIQEIGREQGHEIGSIPLTCALGRDLGISSIELIHLLVELEGQYQIPLSLEEVALRPEGDFRTDLMVSDLVHYLRGKLDEAARDDV
jgi:acyl carrier protein